MKIDITIRLATPDDCAALGVIGPAAYSAAYHHLWPEAAEFARHLQTYGESAVRDFISQPNAYLYVAEAEEVPLGFLSMLIGSPDPIQHKQGGAEIPRIYLLPNARRRGIGRKLLEAAEAQARQEDVRFLWLDAMDTATWAISTYVAWGFDRIGTARFPKPVASEFGGMIVFEKALGV